MKKTVVIGASENPERYSFKAITKLVNHGYTVKALGLRKGLVAGVSIDTEKILYPAIHTVSIYLGKNNQPEYYDYIEQLKPQRVIFNPGTENPEFKSRLEEKGIQVEEACTLVLLSTGSF